LAYKYLKALSDKMPRTLKVLTINVLLGYIN